MLLACFQCSCNPCEGTVLMSQQLLMSSAAAHIEDISLGGQRLPVLRS